MASHASQELVISKCNYFVDVQLWPVRSVLRPEEWLSNFSVQELPHAVQLLNAFMYYSEPLVNDLFAASFQSLSRHFRGPNDTFLRAQAAWSDFVDTVRITYVTGERPNPTDSGYLFARKARQILGIRESQVMFPEAVAAEVATSGPWPVVFVDDFVGSGNQFLTLWNRPMTLPNGSTVTFSQLSRIRNQTFAYCPLVSCQTGYNEIRRLAPAVRLSCCHVLPNQYSALASDSVIWPATLLPTACDFVRKASERAEIPDTDGVAVDDWQGYRKLGLSLAFSHSVPDATLPIFYWEKNGWKPLLRRT